MQEQESEDQKIRQKLYEKDLDLSEQLKQQMQKQEKALKRYFKQYKKPVPTDPTRIDKTGVNERVALFKSVIKPFRIVSSFKEFWKMQCDTPQEKYVLDLCKKNIKKNIIIGVSGSLLLIGLISFKFRVYMTPFMHFFGLFTGLTTGTMFGILKSTQFTLQKFEELGDSYSIGNKAKMQIQRYRMDKHQQNQI